MATAGGERIGPRLIGPVRIAWASVDEPGRAPETGRPRAAGRMLLTALLSDLGLRGERLTQRCSHCGAVDHGALATASGHAVVSVSYAEGLVVAAAALRTDAAAIGVDVERESGSGRMVDLAALFAPLPPPTTAEWTAIEAVVKADGRGLRIPPGDVRVGERPASTLPGARLATLPDGRRFHVARVTGPNGHVVSVAIDPAPESPR